jgi:hypothetical protein
VTVVEVVEDVRLRQPAAGLDELSRHGAESVEPGRVHERGDRDPALPLVALALRIVEHRAHAPSIRAPFLLRPSP